MKKQVFRLGGMERRPRALVAGAAGFVGSHLCERLIAEGYSVIGVDSLLTGRVENLAPLANETAFRFIEHDIVDPLPALGRFSWVFNLASPASPPAYQRYSLRCLRVNSEGTLNLLELARQEQASFLQASTSEVYGDPEQHPQRETYWGNVNPNGPRSVYDEGKRFSESAVSEYHRRFGLPVRIARIFNTYGPRMDPEDGRVVSNFICQALRGEPLTVYGDGSQTRSFQYVDDLVAGLLALTRVDYPHPVNLGNPEEYKIRDLVEVLQEMFEWPLEVEYRPLPGDDPKVRKPDISLAKRLLGWAPHTPLRAGLLRTIPYFEEALRTPQHKLGLITNRLTEPAAQHPPLGR